MKKNTVLYIILAVVIVISLAVAGIIIFTGREKNNEDVSLASESSPENTDTVDIDFQDVSDKFIDILNQNKYPPSEYIPDERIPKHALFDFDKDGIPELLVWDEKKAVACDLDIHVFSYDKENQCAVDIGKMVEFVGHSNIRITSDGNGVIIATRDDMPDTIKIYRVVDDEIACETVKTRTNESISEWDEYYNSEELFSGSDLDVYDTFEDIQALSGEYYSITDLEKEIVNESNTLTVPSTKNAENEDVNEKTVRENFTKFLKLYHDWMDVDGVEAGYDGSDPIQLENEQTAYRIGRSGFNSIEDVDRAFLEYCTPSVYETISPFWELKNINDRLYYVTFNCGPPVYDRYLANVEKISDEKYKVTSITCIFEPGSDCVDIEVWYYEKQSNNKWLITYRNTTDLEHSDLPKGNYYTVSTKSSPLNVRERPTNDSRVIMSIPNHSVVDIRITCNGWGLINITDENIFNEVGWVKMDYLKK